FGGWKASSVGPGAKAGGPNYLVQLARWSQITRPADEGEVLPAVLAACLERCLAVLPDAAERALLRVRAASYARAWRRHFGVEHDPSAIVGEANAFRYRPCRRVIVRGTATDTVALAQVMLAAAAAGVPLLVSLPPDSPAAAWLPAVPGVEAVV